MPVSRFLFVCHMSGCTCPAVLGSLNLATILQRPFHLLVSLLLTSLLLTACTTQPPAKVEPTRTPAASLPDQIRSAVIRLNEDNAARVLVQGRSLPQGVAAFYQQRAYHPAWQDPARLDALLAELADLRFDGLNPNEYSLQELTRGRARLQDMTSVTEQAALDVLATRACLLAMVHLHLGKLTPGDLDPKWNFAAQPYALDEEAAAINSAVEQSAVEDLFNRARPPQAAYQGLREGLRRLYAIADQGGWPLLPDGPSLKPGMRDARVPLLRQRMVAAGLLTEKGAGSELFDEILADSVKQFQREQYLDVDGAVGKSTRAVLNVPVEVRINQVRANLERGRWLLHEIKGDFVLVDIAGFSIHFYRNGQPVWSSRVQVGRPFRSTPIFKSRVTYFTFNPTWTIPPTIFKEDVLPKVRKDPDYLAKNQWQALDSAGKPLDPATIDWNRPGNILLRQAAGPANPLGQVAIRFPNPYAVYLHDTPSKSQFGKGMRAFSSGCIRVERPLELVELLFNDPQKWSREQIEAAIATGATRDVGLVTPVPILLAYYTVAVGGDGRILFKHDIYDRDREVLAALDRR